MPSLFNSLQKKQLLNTPPSFLKDNVQYEVIMGSMAYNVSQDSSDMDVYGFAIPPKEFIFPHLQGKILGFDDYSLGFKQFQQHHINDPSARGGKGREYDLTIYSIVKYFYLVTENNPNMVDSLFVPRNCILHSTSIGEHVRENRHLFIHKGCWHKFKGYAYSQLHKMETKSPEAGSKRSATVEKYGYDVKFAYHVVRLLDEVEQLLQSGDMDITRSCEVLKAIRRGEWPVEKVKEYFNEKEKKLEQVYENSKLPYKPNKNKIRNLLLECLESQYGDLSSCVRSQDKQEQALRDIKSILEKTGI